MANHYIGLSTLRRIMKITRPPFTRIRIRRNALVILQTEVEDLLFNLVKNSSALASHRKRFCITPRDIALQYCLRFNNPNFDNRLRDEMRRRR